MTSIIEMAASWGCFKNLKKKFENYVTIQQPGWGELGDWVCSLGTGSKYKHNRLPLKAFPWDAILIRRWNNFDYFIGSIIENK